MEIPKRFKIANQWIDIILDDNLIVDGNPEFGHFDSIKSQIRLATKLEDCDGNIVELQEEQILNTMWHEIFHAFNWYWNTEFDESLAQSFANFMREFDSTKEF